MTFLSIPPSFHIIFWVRIGDASLLILSMPDSSQYQQGDLCIRFKMEPNLRYNLLKRSGSFISADRIWRNVSAKARGSILAIFNLIVIFQLDCLRRNPLDTFRLSAMIIGDDRLCIHRQWSCPRRGPIRALFEHLFVQ
jgi:hypothetical protein